MAGEPSGKARPPFAPLVERARAQLTGEASPYASMVGERRLLAAWARARARRRRARVLAPLAAVAAAALLGLLLRTRAHPPRALTYVVEGAVANEGYVRVPDDGRASTVRFSDGTALVLAPGTAGRVETATLQGADVVLEDGVLHASVVHRDNARWTVRAGPFTIAVQGTVFDVRWSPGDERVRVALLRGSVRVRGPFSQDGIQLQAGQRLDARAADRSVHVAPITAEEDAPAGAPVDAVADAAAPSPSPSDPALDAAQDVAIATAHNPNPRAPRPPARAAHVAPPAVREWAPMATRGEMDAIVDDAVAQGIDQALAERPAADLAALADASRYAHRPELARRAYLALRERFAGSAEAQQSAFFLARIAEEHDPADAVTWYRRYLDEAPDATLAPEALGRAMLAAQRVGDRALAASLARDYVRRYPDGAFVAAARGIAAGR